jgi:hypothetical protein
MRSTPRRGIPKSAFLWTRGIAARETLGYLEKNGIDAEPLLAQAGLSRSHLSQERGGGVSVASQHRFLDLAVTETNDSLLGLHLAAEMDLRNAGILFYLAASSATAAEALENLAQYAGTTSEAVLYEISPHEDATVVTVRPARAHDELGRQFSEFHALAVIRMLRMLTSRDFAPSRITFAHARNSDLREIHRILRCPVEFAHATESWVLPRSVTELPIISEDSHLLQVLTAHADDLLTERGLASGLPSMVETELLRVLPSGKVQATVVARELGMSMRSLTRRLAEEGTTFGEILDRVRNRLALVTSKISECRSNRSLGCSAIPSLRRSIMPSSGGTEPPQAGREISHPY